MSGFGSSSRSCSHQGRGAYVSTVLDSVHPVHVSCQGHASYRRVMAQQAASCNPEAGIVNEAVCMCLTILRGSYSKKQADLRRPRMAPAMLMLPSSRRGCRMSAAVRSYTRLVTLTCRRQASPALPAPASQARHNKVLPQLQQRPVGAVSGSPVRCPRRSCCPSQTNVGNHHSACVWLRTCGNAASLGWRTSAANCGGTAASSTLRS